MSDSDGFDSLFMAEPAASPGNQVPIATTLAAPWKVLLVDDEPDIHAVLRLAMQGIVVEGRSLHLLDARSADESKLKLQEHPDTALILLDVVMETEQAGLALVHFIRHQLNNAKIQIVLVTGQPGYAPQREVITDYAINGYRLKSELTADNIFVSVYAALRTYQALHQLDQQHQALQEMAAQLQEREARWRAVLETAPDAIALANEQGVVTAWNPGAQRLFGYAPEEIVGQPLAKLIAIHHQTGSNAALSRLYEPESLPLPGKILELTALNRDGEELPVEVVLGAWPSAEGRQFSAIMRDIRARRRMEEQIRHMAFYDVLTNLPNRRLLLDRLAQTHAACKRSGCHGALMMLDLDNFKPLNDSHGHEIGDLLLIEVAKRINECIREIDTVARYGGDEFVVVLGGLDLDEQLSIDQAAHIAEKIRATIALPYLLLSQHADSKRIEHRCTASIGLTLIGKDSDEAELFERADVAMYVVKEGGRNAFRFFEANARVSGSVENSPR